jgi:formate-nitrite transporter family protein
MMSSSFEPRGRSSGRAEADDRRGDEHRGSAAAELEEHELEKAEEEQSLDAAITHEVIRLEGQKELERPLRALAWSGLAAGLSMGFSFVAEALLRSHLPDAKWRPLVTKLGYPVGFLIVSLASQELYTENTLRPIVPLMAKRTGELFRRVSLVWLVVLLTNLVGAFLFALVIGRTEAFRPEVRHAFESIAREAMEGGWWTIALRGLFAGWLIALMVWMIPAAEAAHVLVIFVMTWIVGVAGMAHIIAGSTEVLYLVVTGAIGFGTYLADYMVPTLIGNTVGGVSLVAALNHAQVMSGSKEE